MADKPARDMCRPSFTIDGFEPIERLGSGGFGVVWKAQQEKIGRLVAIKVSSTILENEEDQRFFDRECESLGRLSGHPNIVQVHTTGLLDDGRPYLVLEYIDGGTLTQRIEKYESNERQVVQLGIDLCAGLHIAHSSGVLHRDIKPDNILLRSDGTGVLGDFGIAQLLDSTKSQLGAVVGSLRYMAPEVLSGQRPSILSDLYGVGIAMHTAITRELPFSGESNLADQIAQRVLTVKPTDVATHGFSSGLGELIMSLLAKSPRERPETALQLGNHLRQLAQQLPAEAVLDPKVAESAPSNKPLTGAGFGPGGTRFHRPPVSGSTEPTKAYDPTQVQVPSPSTSQPSAPQAFAGTHEAASASSADVAPRAVSRPPGSRPPSGPSKPPPAKSAPDRGVSVLFEGTEYSSPEQLASALSAHWDVAVWNLSDNGSRFLVEELARAASVWKRPQIRPIISQLAGADTGRRQQLFTDLLIELDPNQPPIYRGWSIGNSARQIMAANIPPAIIDEMRRGEILLRWRHNPDMKDVVSAASRWEASIHKYDYLNHNLRQRGFAVNDPHAGGKLLAAAGDSNATAKLKQALLANPGYSSAGRQDWWAELYSSDTTAGFLLATALFDAAVDQTTALVAEEEKVARRRGRRSAITAAVAVSTLIIIAVTAYRWHELGGPPGDRLTQGWLLWSLTPFLFFWYYLASSKNRGVASSGCLGGLAWFVYLAALTVVGDAIASKSELSPETSAFGLFLTISVITVPLFSLLTYRRLTSRLK